MGALLVAKLLIPFVVVSAILGVLNQKLRVPPSAIFMAVISVSDIVTLNFFFLVKDEGSWLDIGTSISHFCISGALLMFILALERLSAVIVNGVYVPNC